VTLTSGYPAQDLAEQPPLQHRRPSKSRSPVKERGNKILLCKFRLTTYTPAKNIVIAHQESETSLGNLLRKESTGDRVVGAKLVVTLNRTFQQERHGDAGLTPLQGRLNLTNQETRSTRANKEEC
jgi:hypothetical protein